MKFAAIVVFMAIHCIAFKPVCLRCVPAYTAYSGPMQEHFQVVATIFCAATLL